MCDKSIARVEHFKFLSNAIQFKQVSKSLGRVAHSPLGLPSGQRGQFVVAHKQTNRSFSVFTYILHIPLTRRLDVQCKFLFTCYLHMFFLFFIFVCVFKF